MPENDVAIIGAGPAGAAAARLLASWGHRVVVLDRMLRDQPRQEVGSLAESIPPSCRKLFAAIGVLESIDGAGFYRSTGNTVWWGTDQPRRELFAGGGEGYQVERRAFAEVMRACAREAGAELIATGVRDVDTASGDVRLSTDAGELGAHFVLDGSGRAGVIARPQWRVEVPGQLKTVGLVALWRRASAWPGIDNTHTLVESYGDGWAWSVPLSPTTRYVTTMVDPYRTDLARGRSALEVYRVELRKAPHLFAAMSDASLDAGPWGCDASVYTARTYARPPALLVGDAASFIDPLSSYGIKKALASAWLAAVAVHTALRTPAMTTPAFEFFAAREAEMAAALIAQARSHFGAAASSHDHPFWSDRAAAIDLPATREPDVRVLREDPRVLRAFANLKAQPSLALRRGAALQVERRPVVRGHEIVLEDRLFVPEFPNGVRFLRDVDVVGLHDLAPRYPDVPSLFEAYNRQLPPVALPDFLGALSVMTAFNIVEPVTRD